MTHQRRCSHFLVIYCVLSGMALSTSAFMGLSLWGSPAEPWNICQPDQPQRCSCPEDSLMSMDNGLDCTKRGLQLLHDDMVIPIRFRKIYFSFNNLNSIHKETFASNSSHVQELDLSSNGLKTIEPGTFANLENLLKLDLDNNNIDTLYNESFQGITNLTHLNLGYNRITDLPDLLFYNLTSLVELQLTHNRITELSATIFCNQRNLRHLDLTYLELTKLKPRTFGNTTRLEQLELIHNKFEWVPTKALNHIKSSLKMLDLSGNPFETIPAYSVFDLPHLELLTLQQLVHLRNIEAYAFYGLTGLKTLDIRYLPRIRFIDEKAFSTEINGSHIPSPVQDLTLSFTVLERLPEGLLDWSSLKFADLQNNRWRCDCDFAWIKGSPLEELTKEYFYCSSPTRVRGDMLEWLQEDDFVCKATDTFDDTWQWGTIVTLFLVGTLVSLTTVAVLFYRKNGYLCRRPAHYSQLNAQSRESITVVDNAEINTDS